jgi:hypothetical protein
LFLRQTERSPTLRDAATDPAGDAIRLDAAHRVTVECIGLLKHQLIS